MRLGPLPTMSKGGHQHRRIGAHSLFGFDACVAMEALDHPWMRLGHADIPHVTPGLAKAEVCSLERFATFENDMKRLAIRAVAFHLDAVGAC